MRPLPELLIARHAETVYNALGYMQGNVLPTPLTRRGIAQAEAMGSALAAHFAGDAPTIIWSSPAGRTLQTASIVAEHLGIPFFAIRQDARLREIETGDWIGRSYAAIVAESGDITDHARKLFLEPVPGGERYADVAARARDWLAGLAPEGPQLVITHGQVARVLRGALVGGAEWHGVPIAEDVPQGSIMRIANGREERLLTGGGRQGADAA